MHERKKCILFVSVFFIFLLLMIIKIFWSNSNNQKQLSNIELKFAKSDSVELINQIEFLKQKHSLYQSVLDRKENAAWAAFALYLTGLVLFYKRVLKIDRKKCSAKFILTSVLLIFAICVFAFIHAQYSSIYENHAKATASNTLHLKLVDENKPVENFSEIHRYIYRKELYNIQKFRGKMHPLKIVFYFISLEWTKSGPRKITGANTQEATVYFLISFVNLILIFLIWKPARKT